MKIRNVASCKSQLNLKSLKFKIVLNFFTVPDIDFISSLDINTFDSFSLNTIIFW